MPIHFSSPHCKDVIEIRRSPGTPAIGCIRIERGSFRLFELEGDRLQLVALFGSLGDAKNWALDTWGKTPG